ncbi:hypothetical protein AAZX31_11G229900 [Glycine max]|uniref:Sugar phosphate transporter domain-containing protein n=2 Tax=Glycine subgen. Soja TaxID=1462606 RepID=K7LRN7_SOYBN|nr:probable sugar phosphate/phosphate translocator At3g11320 isoform X2 [Glycine max]KAG4975198.1 hypothetical protein JHK87_032019 [Glycine soja]KAG4387488.1 hypothetical protein GLYMA_11G226200v4 [Glycine max]KAG5125348.1 hypothetical protein JHK82_032085 [Glycine max]KAG5146781.1 hypothetical protein JHK84_032324 [Glycine max]KRH31077.1 hypothetical protein GLYMA_11G226200v4 [Glycine max]
MAQIALIAPAATVIPIITGRGKQQKLSYAARRNKVSLASLVPSWRLERVPRLALSNNNNSGDDRKTSVVVKVSEGGAISLPHGWSAQKEEEEDQISEGLKKMKGSNNRFFTVGLVAAWYSSNIGVLLLNKYLLSNYGFKYPIFLTMCHMTACSLFSYVAIAWMKVVPLQTLRSKVQFFKISALSLVFCVSVVFGNISLRYLPVSFNQAIGATTPFFTAVFAYLMTFKREAWLTYLTLVPVVTGVIIASGGEPSFHLFGFIICVAATAARALKSVLQGILLASEGEKLNSMNLLLYMAPMAVVFLLPATLIMEENVVGITLALARDDSKIIWYLLFNSSLAYFVNLTNFLVTKHTSALTLQVLGNAKGAVAVVVSILIFRNPVSVTGMMGYSLTVFGVILYSEAKKRSK